MTLACDSEFIRALAIGFVCGFAFGAVAGGSYILAQARQIMAQVNRKRP